MSLRSTTWPQEIEGAYHLPTKKKTDIFFEGREHCTQARYLDWKSKRVRKLQTTSFVKFYGCQSHQNTISGNRIANGKHHLSAILFGWFADLGKTSTVRVVHCPNRLILTNGMLPISIPEFSGSSVSGGSPRVRVPATHRWPRSRRTLGSRLVCCARSRKTGYGTCAMHLVIERQDTEIFI